MVQEVWNADLSLVEVWRSYKRTHLVESLELARLIPIYLEHLESMGRSAAYIKGMGWILDELGRPWDQAKPLVFTLPELCSHGFLAPQTPSTRPLD